VKSEDTDMTSVYTACKWLIVFTDIQSTSK